MFLNQGTAVKDRQRVAFTVPAGAGSYAPERLTFGVIPSGMSEIALIGVTAVKENEIATMVLELWLPRVDGGTKHPSTFVDTDYVFSGQLIPAGQNAETWALAGYPGAQIRVKSGGTGGTATVSATAF